MFAAAPARATSCDALISNVAPVSTIAYDPFDGVSRSTTFEVELKNNGPDACSLSIAVASQNMGNNRYFKDGGNQLRYVVEWTDGDDLPNNINSPRGWFQLQAGQTKPVALRVKVPSGLIAPASTYDDTLTLRAYKAGSSTQVGPERTAHADAIVEARAQVNIAGTSSSHFGSFGVDQIDFHTLTTGETRDAIVQVRATKAVTISVSSQHAGILQHKVLASDPGVPYSMRLAGENVILTGPPFSLIRNPPVSLDGASYPMKLTIGDVAGRPAGTYQDMLTITVSP